MILCHDIDGLTVVAPYSQEKDIAFYDMTMDEVNSSIDLVTSFHDTEYLIKNAIKRMKFKRR